MAVAVGADLVDVEVVMGVLDGRDAVAATGELRDQGGRRAGLAGVLQPEMPKMRGSSVMWLAPR
jgi:hypothetical protein